MVRTFRTVAIGRGASVALLVAVLAVALGAAGFRPQGAAAALSGSKAVNGCTLTVVNPYYAGSGKVVGYGAVTCAVKKTVALTVYVQRWNAAEGRWQGYGSASWSGYTAATGSMPVYATCFHGWYRTTAVAYVNGVGGSTANQAEYYSLC